MTSKPSRTSPTRPADSVEVFNLDAVASETTGGPFRFSRKGKRYELPNFAEVDLIGFFAELRSGGDVQAGVGQILDALGEDQIADLRKSGGLGMGRLDALVRAWQKHAGVEPGESQGSTDS